jgi:hypothetical protein
MIEGFEKETAPLNDYERKELLPMILSGLKTKKGAKAAVTNKTIVLALKKTGLKINDARVRKIINHIRRHNLIEGLIATSAGYYIAENYQEVESYIVSLLGRESAIKQVRVTMEQYAEKIRPKTYKPLFT